MVRMFNLTVRCRGERTAAGFPAVFPSLEGRKEREDNGRELRKNLVKVKYDIDVFWDL